MNNKTVILSAITLLILASISCSLFTREPQTTPAPEPDFGPTSGPLTIEPKTLPDAQVGVNYEAEIRITQNNTPAGDIYISNGTLPPGLEFVKVEGEDIARISGTPEETGTFTFTVSVWCYGTMVSGQEGDKEYGIIVIK